jgi:hypothetical protein
MVNDDLKGSDVCIITGPREQLSIDILDRIRKLFLPHGITFDTNKQTLFLNGARIRSYPSNRLQDMRGLPNVSIIYCDEAAFFDRELYSEEDIKIAKASASFEREYNLSFSSSTGNVFGQKFIDRAVELGGKYPITINPAGQRVLGIDPGFSSSACGFCVLEYSDDIIKTIYAEQFEKPTFNEMIAKVFELYTTMKPDNILIDGANPEFIEAVKREIGEDSNWFRIHEKLAQYRNNGWDVMKVMKCVPISFAQDGASMLVHAKQLMEFEDPIVAIHPSFTKLSAALRGAMAQEYKYDKDSPYSDIFDAWRMAMKWFRVTK